MIQDRAFRLGGGIDLRPSSIDRYRRPGVLIDGVNYESHAQGYRRILGYERFDGRPSPSATGLTNEQSATRRGLIGKVPGTGPILALWLYRDSCYAFRRSTRTSAHVRVSRSTPAGWADAGAGHLLKASPSGRWQFQNANFYGQAGDERMFGVNPGGQVFQYDGSAWSVLRNRAGNTPVAVAAHADHLFVAYRDGSVEHSAIGNPESYEASEGAAEIALGDRCTGMLEGYADTIFLFGRNSTYLLGGTNASNWRLRRLSSEGGAILHTAAMLNEPLVYDDRGIRSVQATEAYGDFSIATLSDPVRDILDSKRDGGQLPATTLRIRRKSQYWLWFDDGDVVVMTLQTGGRYLRPEFSRSVYELHDESLDSLGPALPTAACSGETLDGRERVFAAFKDTEGAPSGYVYEMERGNSFDGQKIEAYLRLPFNDLGSATTRKRFRQVLVEVDSRAISRFRVRCDYDDYRIKGDELSFDAVGSPPEWDEGTWSQFVWDRSPHRAARARVAGRGRNVSVVLASETRDQPPHLLTGITLLFEPTKVMR